MTAIDDKLTELFHERAAAARPEPDLPAVLEGAKRVRVVAGQTRLALPRQRMLGIAAAVIIAGTAGVVAVGWHRASEISTDLDRPQITYPDQIPPTTVTPTIAPTTTTVFVNPPSYTQIADSVLLDANEYAPGWTVNTGPSKKVVLDSVAAASVPGCVAFLDVVFESDRRPAVTSHRWFFGLEGRPAQVSQYVVVLADDAAAEAMFDGMADPNFETDCFRPYLPIGAPTSGGWCCNPDEPAAPALLGPAVVSSVLRGADDIAYRTDSQYWTDLAGVVHGPETTRSVTVRVGRIITIIDSIKRDEFGAYVDDDQLNAAIDAAVRHARDALSAEPLT